MHRASDGARWAHASTLLLLSLLLLWLLLLLFFGFLILFFFIFFTMTELAEAPAATQVCLPGYEAHAVASACRDSNSCG